MDKHAEWTRSYMQSKQGTYMARVYAEVAERGPIPAGELSDPGKRSSGWWGWWGSGNGKATLEHLYDAGLVAIAGRRGFERLYDITERVIPRTTLAALSPPREEAMKRLICLAVEACGVGTADDIVRYLDVDGWRDRLPPGPLWEISKGPRGWRDKSIAKRLVSELVEEARLRPVRVEGWKEQAYLPPRVRVPKTVAARALVTPFDSLVWERSRMYRLFGMKYSIEMYVPPAKRVYGYYVCPFVLGDTLVARCDLKADRTRKMLIVQSAFLEPGQHSHRVVPHLVDELRQMCKWLQLDRVEVKRRGDLAASLRQGIIKRSR
jgi:uncharacterized protein